MKEGQIEIPSKKEDFKLINELKSIQARLEEERGYWDDGIYNDYLNIVKNINPNSLNDKERFLYKNVLKNQLNILIEGDVGGTYGWRLDSNLSNILRKFIDIKNPQFFNDNMEILTTINEFYSNFNWDKWKPETEGKRPIEELVNSLYNDSLENDSNLLLSFYIKQIKEGNAGMNYSQGLTENTLIYIGDNRYADISTTSFCPEDIKISKKENFDLINNLLKEKDKLEKEYKDIINNEKESLKDENNFVVLDGKKFFGLKHNNNYEKIENLYGNKKHLIFMKIEKLLNEDLNKKVFSKSNDLNGNTLDPVVFSTIWSDDGLRLEIEKKIGISFYDFNLPEQSQILNFLKDLNNGKSKEVKSFSDKYKKGGFRTFLSIEQGGKEMGDKILALGEKLPEDGTRILFKTYSEMIDATEEVENMLKDNLKEKATPEIINNAKESLLLNGKNLLDKYGEKAKGCEGQACEDIGKELEEKLSLAKKSVFAFSAACKVLAENGEFSFEDFDKAKLAYDQSPLAEEMKEKIIKMHKENTKQYPDKLRELWRETLREGLTNPDPNQLVVSAFYEDEVVSTMRVIKREDDSWYGASFNVNPTIQGGRIGSELLKEVLKDLAKDKPFVADCYSKNPMLSTYINKFGFKITKEIENYHDTGELVYEITLHSEEKKEI